MVPVIVSADEEPPSWSQIFAAISRAVRYRPSIELLLEEDISLGARECGPDERCIASQLRAGGAALGFIVVINTEAKPAMLAVRLVEAESSKTVAESTVRVPATKVLEAIDAQAAAALDAAGHPLAAKLVVVTDPPDSMVKVDGLVLGTGVAGAYFVTPGTHQVSAESEDHHPGSAEATAIAGQDVKLELRLVERETLLDSPWLWIAAGAVAVGAVVSIAFATRSTDRYMCAPLEGATCDP